jgi:hypothetical protein
MWRGALSPEDFGGAAPMAGSIVDGKTHKFVEQLSHCSVCLKRVSDRLTRAATPEAKRDASLDGYATVCYLLGVLSAEGISLPPSILDGAASAMPGPQTRSGGEGNACREAGDWLDRMIDKYGRGARGVGGDIGEGIDKVGGCIREVRDNLGYNSR